MHCLQGGRIAGQSIGGLALAVIFRHQGILGDEAGQFQALGGDFFSGPFAQTVGGPVDQEHRPAHHDLELAGQIY